jgi:hypothetical protein
MEAVRTMPFGFSATATATSVSPCPVWGVIWTQDASVSTVHAHSRAVATVAGNSPPPATTEPGKPVTDDAHRWLVGADNSETVVLPQAASANRQSPTMKERISRWTLRDALILAFPSAKSMRLSFGRSFLSFGLRFCRFPESSSRLSTFGQFARYP